MREGRPGEDRPSHTAHLPLEYQTRDLGLLAEGRGKR